MNFACVSDGYSVHVFNDFWSENPVDVAAEYAEHLDSNVDGEGPQERVVFVLDLDDPNAKIVAVSITYEMQPHYFGDESTEEPSEEVIEALKSGFIR